MARIRRQVPRIDLQIAGRIAVGSGAGGTTARETARLWLAEGYDLVPTGVDGGRLRGAAWAAA